jgi:hypothetical protein
VTLPDAVRAAKRASTRPWLLLLLACVAVVWAAETALLWKGTSYLGAGYNAPRIDAATFLLVFLPSALLLDAWLVLLIWTVTLPLLARLTRSRLQIFCGAALLAAGVPVALAGFRYNVYSMLGATFSVALVSSSSTLGPSALLAEALREAPGLLFAGVPLALAALVGAVAVRRFEQRLGAVDRLTPPPWRRLSFGMGITGALGALLLTLTAWKDSPLAWGFEHRMSGAALFDVLGRVTDVDADGFGALARPNDPAPFDPRIHPYAVDVPGNGRDENGIAGDHPAGFDPDAASQAAPVALDGRPNVLLVYLESFRADLLGARIDGREITPFLNRLAREGGASSHAYVHSPWTLSSRMQLLSGRLLHTAGETTLVDDFASRGYTVAWFSGQDDSYGDSANLLGAERADIFYDARQDIHRRTSRSTAPVSLQVSWKTLTGRALDFLSEVDTSRPLFLYFNVVDTHYPYWHSEIDPVLGEHALGRDDIRADRARTVFEAYANTAANVDRAAEMVFDAFRWRFGGADLAVIVTADHGESFYEGGALGHGQSLEPLETRVPFIVWGMGGEWREPIATSEVRAQLLRHLGNGGPAAEVRPHFVPDPDHRVIQYAPTLEEPRAIALRGAQDVLLYDFANDRVELAREGAGAQVLPAERGHELIWRWEALQRQALEPQTKAAGVRAARLGAAHEGG